MTKFEPEDVRNFEGRRADVTLPGSWFLYRELPGATNRTVIIKSIYHHHISVRDGQTSSQYYNGLVVSRSTCPPLSNPPPRANSFVIGTAVINTHRRTSRRCRISTAPTTHRPRFCLEHPRPTGTRSRTACTSSDQRRQRRKLEIYARAWQRQDRQNMHGGSAPPAAASGAASAQRAHNGIEGGRLVVTLKRALRF